MTPKSQFPPIQKSPATRRTYLLKGAKLAQQMSSAAGSTDWASIAAQFLATAGASYTQRTYRLYKACLLEYMTAHGAPPSVLRQLVESSSKSCARRGTATSGKKAKTVSGDDRLVLLEALRARRSGTAQTAADYFEAGLIVGPRPIEWVGARLSTIPDRLPADAPAGASHVLVITNAKRDIDGVRGNGVERTVYLTLSARDGALIARVVADAVVNKDQWQKHYNRLRAALRYAAKTIWPRRKRLPCFYSTRHQSQADAKASGVSPAAIAAMFGHASDNTGTQHYARGSQGDKNMYKLAPSDISLAKVRNRRATFRLADRTRAKNVTKGRDEGT